MQKYKIIIAYDGTDFCGWAHQPGKVSVATCLEQTFFKLFKQSITLLGASRTDTGVHALGQVAQFYLDTTIPEYALLKAWNDALPESIHIRDLRKIDQSFNPCARVKQKTYHYVLFLKKPMPHVARYGWLYPFMHMVDLKKFKACLDLYTGEHDFASFCKVEDPNKSTIRRIDSIAMRMMRRWGLLVITIKGKSFLHFQIRRMIGYALDVARRDDLTVEYLKQVMASKNPCQTLLKASGKGLILRKVIYHDEGFN